MKNAHAQELANNHGLLTIRKHLNADSARVLRDMLADECTRYGYCTVDQFHEHVTILAGAGAKWYHRAQAAMGQLSVAMDSVWINQGAGDAFELPGAFDVCTDTRRSVARMVELLEKL